MSAWKASSTFLPKAITAIGMASHRENLALFHVGLAEEALHLKRHLGRAVFDCRRVWRQPLEQIAPKAHGRDNESTAHMSAADSYTAACVSDSDEAIVRPLHRSQFVAKS